MDIVCEKSYRYVSYAVAAACNNLMKSTSDLSRMMISLLQKPFRDHTDQSRKLKIT